MLNNLFCKLKFRKILFNRVKKYKKRFPFKDLLAVLICFSIVFGFYVFWVMANPASPIIEFTADTRVVLLEEPEHLFVRTNSKCDRLEVSESVLTVDVPPGSSFTLGTATHNVLGLTPSNGIITLTFNTTHFGNDSYIDQWTLGSATTIASVELLIGVPLPNRSYFVKVDGVGYRFFNADSLGYVKFTYTGGFSERVFTIEQRDRPRRIPALVITDIRVIDITQTSAVIEWITNRPALSRVEYGLTPAYRCIEEQQRKRVINHQIILSNLKPETEYHFRVVSVCERGRTAISPNQTFRTLAKEIIDPPVEEVVEPPVEEEIIKEELQAQIKELQTLIKNLEAQIREILLERGIIEPEIIIPEILVDFVFETNLSLGTTDEDVRRLQIFLNLSPETRLAETGPGSPGNETLFFGRLTHNAVIRFQEKHKQEILASWELTKGTGFVGKTTRVKINEILGR